MATLLSSLLLLEFPESDSVVYESANEFNQDGLHMDLKRDYSSHSSYSSSPDRHQSLFDEYQYFTPGSYPSIP
ncbi:BIG/ATPase V1 complex subunit S1 [Penicillium herquei]|nr:BIG/ATPase V1 complex subunit S1 [Penicillium herquei]